MTSDMERVMIIVKTIGKIPQLGPDDDIHDAGMTSLARADLRIGLEDEFSVEIPDDDRFPAARTVRALHAIIEELVR
jgi:acyl carrier protein